MAKRGILGDSTTVLNSSLRKVGEKERDGG